MAIGEGADGWPAEKILGAGAPHGYGYDDIVFLPAPEVSTDAQEKASHRFSKNISLKRPFVGSPCRTVTEDAMAIALALQGGIGIIHKDQSIDDQVAMVRRVKEHQLAFNFEPKVLGPRATVQDAARKMAEEGCSCLPVTHNGVYNGRFLGLITRRDLDSLREGLTDPNVQMCVTSAMITDAVTVSFTGLADAQKITFTEARTIMLKHKVGKLPLIDNERNLLALICRGDQKTHKEYPLASRDPNMNLLVVAAVSVDEEVPGDKLGWQRAQELYDRGPPDAYYIETDHGVCEATLAFIKKMKGKLKNVDIVCGRVYSLRQAEELCKVEVDGLLVGAPPLPGCAAPSRSRTAGCAEATTLFQIARMARMNYCIPVVAEGGLHTAGDLAKAFCLGASTVAPRLLLSRTLESPGEHYYRQGVRIKLRSAQDGDSERLRIQAGQQPIPAQETFQGPVVDGGRVEDLLAYLVQRVQATTQGLGLKGLNDVHPSLASGVLRLEVQTPRAPMPPGGGLLQRKRIESSGLFSRW